MFSNPDLWKFIFGRLTWDSILPETIVVYTFFVVAAGGIAVVGARSPISASGAICGTSGSRASITRRSA